MSLLQIFLHQFKIANVAGHSCRQCKKILIVLINAQTFLNGFQTGLILLRLLIGPRQGRISRGVLVIVFDQISQRFNGILEFTQFQLRQSGLKTNVAGLICWRHLLEIAQCLLIMTALCVGHS